MCLGLWASLKESVFFTFFPNTSIMDVLEDLDWKRSQELCFAGTFLARTLDIAAQSLLGNLGVSSASGHLMT